MNLLVMDNFFKDFINAMENWNRSIIIHSSGISSDNLKLSGNKPVSNDWLIILVNKGNNDLFYYYY